MTPPISPPSICTAHGCGTLVFGGGKCPSCLAQSRKDSDSRRPNATQRGYDTRWSAFSKRYLRDHPMCECDECGRLPEWQRQEATDVDHIDGRGPNGPRGYDATNCQALSKAHHSRKTAREDGAFGRPKANG
jgi:5-methylcytosine-specific restriction protein A